MNFILYPSSIEKGLHPLLTQNGQRQNDKAPESQGPAESPAWVRQAGESGRVNQAALRNFSIVLLRMRDTCI